MCRNIKKPLDYDPECSIAEATRDEFETLYCQVKSSILVLISAKPSLQTSSCSKKLNATENLPKLKLPQYSGKYSDYQNFINLFTTLVDSNEKLTVIEKYNHLVTCLSGSALRTVQALDLSEENYGTALALLKSRFDNKFLMCQEHIKDLFSLPKVQKGSSENLRILIDKISAHFNALSALMSYEEIANALVVYLALSSLDADTQAKVEEAINYNEPFNWSDCVKILSKRCQILETRCHKPNVSEQQQPSSHNKNNDRKNRKVAFTAINSNCSICNQNDHPIWKCSKFLEMQPIQRFEIIKRLSLCINCFAKQHTVKQCKSSSCKHCSGMHNTLLHRGSSANYSGNQQQQQLQLPSSSSLQPTETSGGNEASKTALVSQHQFTANKSKQLNLTNNNLTILATAVVEIADRHGQMHKARALLDSASQSNFMTQNLANLLRLDKLKTNTIIGGIGESEMCAKYSTTAKISSQHTSYSTSLHFIILPKITGAQPSRVISTTSWEIPSNICLADTKFNIPQQVDLLIGADTFFQLLRGSQIQLGTDSPTLFETTLGWIVSGKCNALTNSKSVFKAVQTENAHSGLEALVQKFWELDIVSDSTRKWSNEQTRCKEHFKQYTKRLNSGRFVVKLPLKQLPSTLGNSQNTAVRRFHNLEKRLQGDSELKASYSEFLTK